MTKTLFISHSTTDDKIINTIAAKLKAAGFTVWVDHDHGIELGMPNWDRAIRTAINVADVGIFVMSEKALASDICAAECLLVRELGDPLYVLRLEACKPQNIWTFIKMAQYADLVTDFDGGLNKLIRVLNGEKGADLPEAMRAVLTGFDEMRQYLPYFNNPLRGRQADLDYIAKNLSGGVLQIVAPGGFGKSRLVAEVAQNHPDGAVWHRCSPVSQDADLLMLLRAHLRLPDNADEATILTGLADKRPLVVIDNAEDVTDDKRAGYVKWLNLMVGRGVPVILTARAIWMEFKPRHEYAPRALSVDIAAQLALDFAASNKIDLTPAQAADLAQKARLHPRLIEFAVGQLHERTLERVLRQLSELTHADVKEALDEMILKTVTQMANAKGGAQAEALLRRLTLLQGTFALDAAQALAPESLADKDALEDALIVLGRWQFVRRDATTERYSLAELVREALGQPADPALFAAYAGHFTARAKMIFKLPPEQWKDHDHDLPNILALGDSLVTRYAAGQIDAQTALDFAIATYNFVFRRMEYRRLAWLEMGLAAAQKLGDTRRESLFINSLGLVWDALGDKRKALAYYEQALPLFRAVGDRSGEATTLNNIGMVWKALGEPRKALDYFEQALPLRRAVEDRGGEATALNNIGGVWQALGEQRKALDYYEQALPIYRALGDKSGEATTLNNIGLVWKALGEPRKALDYFEQALPILQSVGNRGGEATTLNNIGRVWDALGEPRKALAYYEQALPLIRAVGDRSNEAGALNNIGGVWSALGDKRKALAYLEQALPLYRAVGDQSGEAGALNNIGMVWKALGEPRKALAYLEQALPLRRAVEDRSGEATTLNNIGGVWDDLGEPRKALAYLEQALPLYRAVGDRGGEAVTCFNIGMIYDALGDLDNAIAYVERCVVLAEQIESPYLGRFRQDLTNLKRKRDGGSEPTEEERRAEAMTMLRGIYDERGADAVREVLVQNGIPEEVITQILAQLGRESADGGGG